MKARSIQRMPKIIIGMAGKELMKMAVRVLLVVGCGALALPLARQQQGPLPPPPPGTIVIGPAEPGKTNSAPQEPASHLLNEPPPIHVEPNPHKLPQHQHKFPTKR